MQKEEKPAKPLREMTGHEVLQWIFPPRVVHAVDAFIEKVNESPIVKPIIKKKDSR